MRKVNVGGIEIGGGEPFVLIAGPCVIEGEKVTRRVAARLKEITSEVGVPLIFKSSYDKANRTSLRSFRGPGLDRGLKILQAIREEIGIPVLSDVHRFEEIERASEVLDVAQIPAFLCRQTDFVLELARHARVVNIKKGQFLAPWDVQNVVRKVESTGNRNILITERGASFGYNNLVSDMRSIPILRSMGYPVVFDATHSVQLPGGAGEASGGERAMAVFLARAAAAVGVDALFMEVHPDPDRARCDGPNSLALDTLRDLLVTLKGIDGLVKNDMRKGR
ncbi:MAG: 3-deoxy-8-phosphooctulonate synthase [Syntrophobacterales bacterium]|nr:3-deoxy-8-phosphooctulonate synthase [Syntrophobacterales bacterium]